MSNPNSTPAEMLSQADPDGVSQGSVLVSPPTPDLSTSPPLRRHPPPPPPGTLRSGYSKAESSSPSDEKHEKPPSLLSGRSSSPVQHKVRRPCRLARKANATMKGLLRCFKLTRANSGRSSADSPRRAIETATTAPGTSPKRTSFGPLTSHPIPVPSLSFCTPPAPGLRSVKVRRNSPSPDTQVRMSFQDWIKKESTRQTKGEPRGTSSESQAKVAHAEHHDQAVATHRQPEGDMLRKRENASALLQANFDELIQRNLELLAKLENQQKMLEHNDRLIKMYEARLRAAEPEKAGKERLKQAGKAILLERSRSLPNEAIFGVAPPPLQPLQPAKLDLDKSRTDRSKVLAQESGWDMKQLSGARGNSSTPSLHDDEKPDDNLIEL